jgi:hypothetical protein
MKAINSSTVVEKHWNQQFYDSITSNSQNRQSSAKSNTHPTLVGKKRPQIIYFWDASKHHHKCQVLIRPNQYLPVVQIQQSLG